MTRQPFPSHLVEKGILSLMSGDNTLDELADAAAHAQECPPCASRLADAREFRHALRQALTFRPVVRSLHLDTPIGALVITASDAGISRVQFGDAGELPASSPDELLDTARRQLREYFEGTRRSFDLPLDLGTVGAFQRSVLEETATIPPGSLRSYAEVAHAIGRPGAARAVGGALNRNPLPVLVPCHRVVGSSGQLVGYAGGLETKRHLLVLEGAILA